jgi:GNAT superfamily N-acetyltransferase
MGAETTPYGEDLTVRPRPDGSDIRKVTEADVSRVAEALARAFEDDPFMSWVFSDDSERLRRLTRGFDLLLRKVWLPQDEGFTTDRRIGAAMWMPPGTWRLHPLEQLRLLPAMISRFRGDLGRLARVLIRMESEHPRRPHYYLPVIGLEPEWQGRGFGAALLRPTLERCDEEALPAYLEASSPRNRALYERHGFEATGEVTIADSPPFWPMWREPNS